MASDRKLFVWNNHKSYRGMVEDAAIIAGFSMFTRLAAFVGSPEEAAWTAFLSFGLAFFAQLTFERGLKSKFMSTAIEKRK